MGGPTADERGVANRGTAYRIAGPPPGAPVDYPAFHVRTLGLIGAGAIPDALAYALKWQLEFIEAAARPLERKEIADDLIAIWHFLKEMEESSPRDGDGTLLVRDWLWVMANTKEETELVETETGESILVTRSREEPPLPVWAPTLFPPDMPLDLRASYPARPKNLEEIPPFSDAIVRRWILTSLLAPDADAGYKPPRQEPEGGEDGVEQEIFTVEDPLDESEPNADDAEKAMLAAARTVDRSRWSAARLAAFKGYTPTVNAAIARLATTTLGDIQRHTGVTFKSAYLDQPLLKYTEVILYHSVFSFALDRNGEPFDLRYSREGRGMVDYPILIDGPGEQVRRFIPADDGVYISVQKYGSSIFRLNDAGIKKLLFGTIGSFEEYGYGASNHSGVHKAVQSYVDRLGSYAYIAAVTVPGAYAREEITLSRIRSRIPEFVDVVTPYLVKEVMTRAKHKLENWEEFAKEVVTSLIQELILEKVRDKIRDYLIKKIGKRIVPGVNAVAAVVDLVAGGEERTRIRNIIACMIVALKSNAEEDMHIAAKTCSKVVADEFEDAVFDALIKRAKKTKAKLRRKNKHQREADEQAERDQAREKAKADSEAEAQAQKQAQAQTQTADAPQSKDVAGKPVDRTATDPAATPDMTLRNDGGAKATLTADKTDKKGNRGTAKPPRPPNKRERKEQEGWAEAQRRHEEKVRRKIEEEKKEAEKKAAANGDPAGTTDTGTGDKGHTNDSRGLGDTRTGSTGAARGNTGTAVPNTGASATNTGAGSANTAANGSNTGTRRGNPRGTTQQAPQRPPPDPNAPRGTPENPRRVTPGPEPDPEPMKVKDPDAPEGTHDVRDRPNVRTGRASHEEILRANAEKERGAFPLDHDAHHNAPKKGGDGAGEGMRDSLSQSGVSVDDAANASPARGLPRDRRAPHESSSQHWGLHKKEQWEKLRRELETVKGDPGATRDVLRKHGIDLWEGRDGEPPDFWLGPDPDPPEPKDPKPTGPRKKK